MSRAPFVGLLVMGLLVVGWFLQRGVLALIDWMVRIAQSRPQ